MYRSSPTLPDTVPSEFRGPFSYILCSEILYLPQFHRALLKTITQFSGDQTVVILLWKHRGLGEERFFEIASRPSTGWDVQFVSALFCSSFDCTRQVTFCNTCSYYYHIFTLVGPDCPRPRVPGPILWDRANDQIQARHCSSYLKCDTPLIPFLPFQLNRQEG